MVNTKTSFLRSGLKHWLIQRFSAVVLGAYTLCMLGTFIVYPDLDYEQWRQVFESNVIRLFSLVTLASLCAHAWIGMWTIGTDYLTPIHLGNSATSIRLVYQAACVLLIVIYLIWGMRIFWGS